MTTLQRIINEETARGMFRGSVHIKDSTFEGMVSNFSDPKIDLGVDNQYLLEHTEESYAIFRAILDHEINHVHYNSLLGCPRNLDSHIAILDSVSNVLFSNGYQNVLVSKAQTLYGYMANLFTDFVDNSQLGQAKNHFGFWLWYAYNFRKQFPSPLFDAFISFQEYTYGTKRSKQLMKPFHTNDTRVLQAMNEFITPDINKRINDLQNFYMFAEHFVKSLLPLIDQSRLSDPNYLKITFLPLESELFPSELKNPEFVIEIVDRAYKKSGSSFNPPKFLDPQDCLKLIYQRLARTLELRVNASTRSSSFPVASYGRRTFDSDDDPSDILVSFDGKLRLEVPRYEIEIPMQYQSRPSNLPPIQFALLDTSDSTRKNLGAKANPKVMNPWSEKRFQWTDDSVYHYELLAWFGFLEYLRKQGALKQTSIKFANFSTGTSYAENLNEAYKTVFSPQFGSTNLDSPSKIFGSPTPKRLVFTLSDGEIDNWESIKDDFISQARRHYYFHLQIGDGNSFTSDLENAKIPVFYDNGLTLGRKIIDLTRPFVSRSPK